jgi:hypothetical protein
MFDTEQQNSGIAAMHQSLNLRLITVEPYNPASQISIKGGLSTKACAYRSEAFSCAICLE